MMRVLLFLVLLVGNVAASAAQVVAPQEQVSLPPMVIDCPGYAHNSGDSEYKVINKLDDMPVVVAENIKAYLLARVGISFFKTLAFAGGQQLNLVKVDSKKLPAQGDFKKLANYYVRFNCLMIQQPDGKYFEAGASFDAHGKVIDSVNLLPFARRDIGHGFVSAKEAAKIGRANWEEKNNANWIKKKDALLSYSPLYQTLVWWFSKATAEAPGRGHLRRIFIDASTGAIVRTRNNVHKYAPF